MRFLGIDYGEKRIGLSYGDDLGLASPLPAAVERTKEERLAHIESVLKTRRVTDIVVGHPLNMDGTSGFKAKEVERFVAELQRRFNLPVHLVDERLTSVEAEARIQNRKRRPTRDSGEIDSIAASVILQDYLDQKFPPLEPSPEEWD